MVKLFKLKGLSELDGTHGVRSIVPFKEYKQKVANFGCSALQLSVFIYNGTSLYE